MAVKIGHLTGNEKGTSRGGVPGDQTGREGNIRNWYLNEKGWVVIRPKDSEAAEKIAKAMEMICENDNFGYCQDHRTSGITEAKKHGYDPSKVSQPCELDCSSGVRLCVLYAGIDIGDVYTGNLKTTLQKTGMCTVYTSEKYCTSEDYLKRGDILVTKTKGHTVVVLSNGSKVKSTNIHVQKIAITAADKARSKDKSLSGSYTVTGNLYLRDGAGTHKKSICVIPKGTVVKNYGYYTSFLGVKWLYITFVKDGVTYTGFSSSKFLRK